LHGAFAPQFIKEPCGAGRRAVALDRASRAPVLTAERTALVSGLANPRDLLFAANWTPAPRVRVQSSFEVGLSSGAPNYGLTGGLAVRF